MDYLNSGLKKIIAKFVFRVAMKKIYIPDAVCILWVTQDTIKNCFREAGFTISDSESDCKNVIIGVS